jgi:hypothetical protein
VDAPLATADPVPAAIAVVTAADVPAVTVATAEIAVVLRGPPKSTWISS